MLPAPAVEGMHVLGHVPSSDTCNVGRTSFQSLAKGQRPGYLHVLPVRYRIYLYFLGSSTE
jgi:hypothetical protein